MAWDISGLYVRVELPCNLDTHNNVGARQSPGGVGWGYRVVKPLTRVRRPCTHMRGVDYF